ncbi:MAG: FeoA family protein [Bacteroidia bacterium]
MAVSLSQLTIGQSAIISAFTDEEIALKLIELGCIPGVKVTMIRRAPMGDPLAFACSGALISIRKEEAAGVLVESE